MDAKQIGKNIRRLMEEKGFTLDSLSEACGWSRNSLIRWRKGEAPPHAIALYDMAKAMEISVDEFFEGE